MAKGAIVVSLRSKGLPSINKALFFDLRYQAVQLTTELLDIFLSFFVSLACLSWSSLISVAVIAVSIAGTQTTDFAAADLDLVFVFFMYLVLPLLAMLCFVFSRRERALRSLADLKAALVALLLQRPSLAAAAGGGAGGAAAAATATAGSVHQHQAQAQVALQREAGDELHRRCVGFVDDLRQYLQHRRPYARHFYLPYRTSEPSPNDELLRVSRELGGLQRKVHRGVRDMHLAAARLREAGGGEVQVAALVAEVKAIHAATERLINIKEARTPVVLRAAVRWFMVVLIPVSMGPFWNRMATMLNDNGALSGILGVLTQIALMALVDTAVAMEDPFDDTALDAISLYEMVDQVGVMTTPLPDADGGEPEASAARRNANGANGSAANGNGANGPYETIMRTGAHVGVYMGEAAAGGGGGSGGGGAGGGGGGSGGGAAAAPESATQAGTQAAGEVVASSAGLAQTAAAGPSGSGGTAPGGGGSGGGGPGGTAEPTASTSEQQLQQQPPGPSVLPAQPHPVMLRQPGGVPAMRASVVNSEATAVGPPSVAEPYHGGGGGGGGGAAAGAHSYGSGGVPSVTSPPLHDIATSVRGPVAMPPMPALAGHAMYRTQGPGAAAAQLHRAL